MRSSPTLLVLSTAALAASFITGCARGGPGSSVTGAPLTVYGRTDAPLAGDVKGEVKIDLSTIGDDGTSEPIAGATIETDADGRFFATLTDVDSTFLVALSSGPSARYIGIADTRAAVNGQLALPVLDEESTVEAEVFLTTYRAGDWDEGSQLHQLRDLITPRIVDAVLVAPDYREAVRLVSASTTAAMAAWESSLHDLGFEAPDLEGLEVMLRSAAAAADIERIESGGSEGDAIAANRYARAREQAFRGAGLSPYALAVAAVASAEAMHAATRGVDSRVADTVGWRGEELRLRYAGEWLLDVAGGLTVDAAERRALRQTVDELRRAAEEARGAPERDRLRAAYAPLVQQLEAAGKRTLVDRRYRSISAEAITTIDAGDDIPADVAGSPVELGRHVGARVVALMSPNDRPDVEKDFLKALVVSQLPGRGALGELSRRKGM